MQRQSQEMSKQTVNIDFISRRKTKEDFLAFIHIFLSLATPPPK